jgi:hypothetical protein
MQENFLLLYVCFIWYTIDLLQCSISLIQTSQMKQSMSLARMKLVYYMQCLPVGYTKWERFVRCPINKPSYIVWLVINGYFFRVGSNPVKFKLLFPSARNLIYTQCLVLVGSMNEFENVSWIFLHNPSVTNSVWTNKTSLILANCSKSQYVL